MQRVVVLLLVALTAISAHAQDPTPASMRRLARCFERWAAHRPPADRPGYCDRHGLDCIDPPVVDPADTALTACAAREHAPPPVFPSPLGLEGTPTLTPAAARGIARCLRERAALDAPTAADQAACFALPTPTP